MEEKIKNKVILISPPYNMERIMSAKIEIPSLPPKNQQIYPQLGLAYIAAHLRRAGYVPVIVDCTAMRLSLKETVRLSIEQRPLFVGLYINTFSLYWSYLYIKRVKEIDPEIVVVVGGPHITAHPDAVEELNADLGIRGEAEESAVMLAESLSERSPYYKIPGIVYYQDSTLVKTTPAVYDISKRYLPDRPEGYQRLYRTPFDDGPMTSIITSAGCPYKCIFCSSAGTEFRQRETADVTSEILYLKDRGYRYLQFQDDALNINKKWLIDLCQMLINKNIKRYLRWDCNVRAELADEDQLAALSAAGCRMIRFGVEIVNRRIRNDIIRKHLDDSAIERCSSVARKYRLKTLGYFMLGFPEEDILSSCRDILKWARWLRLNYIDVSLTKILPGALLFNRCLKERRLDANVWRRLTCGLIPPPVYIPNGFSLELMRRARSEIFSRFYGDPAYLLSELFCALLEHRLRSTIRSASLLFT